MTKDFSLAGLRIAYIQADSRIIGLLRRIQPEWSINAPALAAAEAALDSIDQYIIQWHTVRKETTFLETELRRIGLPVFSSSANFILAGFRCSRIGTVIGRELFHRRLLQQGVAVRDCSSFGLPDHVRIGTRTEPENRILVSVLQQEGLWEL
jgi:histidinol-phosphate/aromatic aminotransferase/cobyric acid decarboxylase-like protein